MHPWLSTDVELHNKLSQIKRSWLVTGAAGFIGSHIVEVLLSYGHKVKAIDNFASGFPENLESLRKQVGEQWANFQFVEDSITNSEAVRSLIGPETLVIHMAALGSVPRSIKLPENSHDANVNGQFNILNVCREASVQRVVFASSSSVYGDDTRLPKKEEFVGVPLSPYAATKKVNELYGHIFYKTYGLNTVGLRFFNVFGPRQNFKSEYAAVIPKWIRALIYKEPTQIFGDGLTSRDFTFIGNVVCGVLRVSLFGNKEAMGATYNLAAGGSTSLNDLHGMIRASLSQLDEQIQPTEPTYAPFRAGDISHSQADISKVSENFGFKPGFSVKEGLHLTVDWYLKYLK